jgi:hypothetical protein
MALLFALQRRSLGDATLLNILNASAARNDVARRPSQAAGVLLALRLSEV